MTVIEKLQMNANQANSDFVAIKNKIVENGVEVADGTRTAEYASKVDDVYEAGRKSQYDEFWDAYQENGNRTDYRYAFAGFGWQDESFKPKYPIIPINVYHMFAESKIKNVNLINLSKASICSYAFLNSKIRNIWKLVIAANIYCANLFNNCTELENLLVEGNIGQNGFNVQWSTKLSKASWISIVTALSATTSGMSITGSLASVNTAFETSAGANDGSTSAEWLNLIATKSNWTVNLV